MTSRRRIWLVLLVAGVLGWLYLPWALGVGRAGARYLVGGFSFLCEGVNFPGLGYSCFPDSFSLVGAATRLLLVTVVLLAVGVLLARWAMVPVRRLAGSVSRLGPQNLGERTRPSGPRDEARALGEAIDAMLDRVAEGYEGQRRFAANASHELRTPLAVQRTLIEVSLATAPTESQRELLSRQLLATNERNEALIESLLVLAETDRGLVSRTPQRLDATAADAVALLADAAHTAQVHVRTELAPVTVVGEPALLDRLAVNLVQNAVKHNGPGGWVTVVVREPGELVVANSGPEVAAVAVPGLFEPFRRGSADRIRHGGGVGLGLTIVASIARAHEATVHAEPRAGGGLVVTVRFPG